MNFFPWSGTFSFGKFLTINLVLLPFEADRNVLKPNYLPNCQKHDYSAIWSFDIGKKEQMFFLTSIEDLVFFPKFVLRITSEIWSFVFPNNPLLVGRKETEEILIKEGQKRNLEQRNRVENVVTSKYFDIQAK